MKPTVLHEWTNSEDDFLDDHDLRHQELRHDEEGARLAREHGVAYAFHDYKAGAWSTAKLDGWVQKLGWETLLNRAGTTFRKLPDADKEELDAARPSR